MIWNLIMWRPNMVSFFAIFFLSANEILSSISDI